MDDKNYEAALEAILFTMGGAVELGKLAAAIDVPKEFTKVILGRLADKYKDEESGLQLIELDGAYQLCTKPQLYDYLIRIAKMPKKYVLTDVQIETLSIIAYKQPVTKAEIENIRGVSSDHAVNRLVEYGLVCESGRLNAPGRPILFRTTEEFLRVFGIQSLDELPRPSSDSIAEFKKEAEETLGYIPDDEQVDSTS